jgi:Ca2+:H+ antiporter
VTFHLQGLSDADNRALIREVAELAATAATVAARDAQNRPHHYRSGTGRREHRSHAQTTVGHEDQTLPAGVVGDAGGQAAAAGGHDAPNWGRSKSVIILLVATVAYAIIAEILVDTVDSVLDNIDIDEKFLGITLFALVPNTTEFLNAISFAINGNIALSMEIGSAYVLQVCLLQIPALVAYSALWGRFVNPDDVADHTFTLIFPQVSFPSPSPSPSPPSYKALSADTIHSGTWLWSSSASSSCHTCTVKARAITSRAPSSS